MSSKSNRSEEGLKLRRVVLGKEHADRTMAEVDEITRPFEEELVNEFLWGTIWSRPGVPLKIRSLIVLAMLTALNRPQEIKTHIRGALNNGCTKEEICEVFFQAAAYLGLPAAKTGLYAAKQSFAEFEVAQKKAK